MADCPCSIWVLVFVYTISTVVIVQLLLLPYIFPAWDAGDELIAGMDGSKFHRLTLELTRQIR